MIKTKILVTATWFVIALQIGQKMAQNSPYWNLPQKFENKKQQKIIYKECLITKYTTYQHSYMKYNIF